MKLISILFLLLVDSALAEDHIKPGLMFDGRVQEDINPGQVLVCVMPNTQGATFCAVTKKDSYRNCWFFQYTMLIRCEPGI